MKYMFPVTVATCLCAETVAFHFDAKLIMTLVWKRALWSENECYHVIQHTQYV